MAETNTPTVITAYANPMTTGGHSAQIRLNDQVYTVRRTRGKTTTVWLGDQRITKSGSAALWHRLVEVAFDAWTRPAPPVEEPPAPAPEPTEAPEDVTARLDPRIVNFQAPAPADRDFDGYLMIFMIDGDGAGVWRVTRDDDAWCESCPNNPTGEYSRPLYRTVSLVTDMDPQLGVCQDCMEEQWANRLDTDEPSDGSGARAYILTGKPANQD